MKKVKFSETIENWLLVLVGAVCVLIPFLDFLGALENIEWIKSRITVFSLLSIGLLATYLVSHLNNKEQKAIERQRELLSNINLDEASARFKELLESLWKKRESDIDKLFAHVAEQSKAKINLDEVLKVKFEEMVGGNYFGARVVLPWDFTLCAFDYEGIVIYHPGIPKGYRLDDSLPQTAIKERNGNMFWENSLCSEQLAGIFPNRAPGNKRFTKAYFRDFPDYKAVVVFESHINIIDKLPAISLKKTGEQSTTK